MSVQSKKEHINQKAIRSTMMAVGRPNLWTDSLTHREATEDLAESGVVSLSDRWTASHHHTAFTSSTIFSHKELWELLEHYILLGHEVAITY